MAMVLTILAYDALARGMLPAGSRIMGLPDTINEVSDVIIAPPLCQIDNDKPMDANFADIIIQQIDGEHFTHTVPVNFTCTDTFKGDLNFTLKASSALFDANAVATSQPNLGIRITRNGSVIKPGVMYAIDWRTAFELKALPIKQISSTLITGVFTAIATMLTMIH